MTQDQKTIQALRQEVSSLKAELMKAQKMLSAKPSQGPAKLVQNAKQALAKGQNPFTMKNV